ncbi:hypothetical protein Syun_007629 [Stephania yunnanensis]|uniref:Bifunctional inhibitor/plant lipid transfer protein/seed storage helical domain-containing protein n=1 Tax=Stephania yunnanensis TaxID=152371 RepID=A0AAP0PYX0_9MAGN
MPMERSLLIRAVAASVLLAIAPIILSVPVPPSPPPPQPLCLSQYALVNQACSVIPSANNHTRPNAGELNDPLMDNNREHHHHRRNRLPEAEECCKWLKEMDDLCVCELLVRLPPFMRRIGHAYTVTVLDSCNVTYVCDGQLGN